MRERPRTLDDLVAETGVERAKLCRRLLTMVERKMLRRIEPLRRRSKETGRYQSRYALGTNVPPTMLLSMFDQRPRPAGGRSGHMPSWALPPRSSTSTAHARTVRFDRSVPVENPELDDSKAGQ